jgi:hypothetical protein
MQWHASQCGIRGLILGLGLLLAPGLAEGNGLREGLGVVVYPGRPTSGMMSTDVLNAKVTAVPAGGLGASNTAGMRRTKGAPAAGLG